MRALPRLFRSVGTCSVVLFFYYRLKLVSNIFIIKPEDRIENLSYWMKTHEPYEHTFLVRKTHVCNRIHSGDHIQYFLRSSVPTVRPSCKTAKIALSFLSECHEFHISLDVIFHTGYAALFSLNTSERTLNDVRNIG